MNEAAFLSAALLGIVLVASEGDALGKSATCSFPATSDPPPSTRSDEIEGGIATDAPVMNGRLFAAEGDPSPPSPTCARPDSSPELVDPTKTFRYASHTFKNYKPLASCVSITVYRNASNGSAGPLQVAAYSNSFNPEDARDNYLGAEHSADADVYHFSIAVPARSTFVVVVNDGLHASESTAPIPYSLFVGGCGAPADANAPKGHDASWPAVAPDPSSSTARRTDAISTATSPAVEPAPRVDTGCNAAGPGTGAGAWLFATVVTFAMRRRRRR